MYETVPNFGDVLNRYLWNPWFGEFMNRDDDILMLGIGTLLGHSKEHNGQVIVCGSGSGYGGDFSQLQNEGWKIFFVRGPSTAKVLGLSEDMAITDPAILTPEIFPAGPKTGKTLFVPHWETAANPLWKSACEQAGVTYIDPLSDIAGIMKEISGAKLVIAEAMHAAIIADAYRVPWVSVSSQRRINGFKWQDWASSLGLNHSFQHYAPLGLTNHVLNLSTGRAQAFSAPVTGEKSVVVSNENRGLSPVAMTKTIAKKILPQKWHADGLEILSHAALVADRSIDGILKTGVYNKFFETTIADIAKSAAQSGQLSDEVKANAQKDRLKERLEDVRSYLANYQKV